MRETIGTRELQEIIDKINLQTLKTYLNNYRFNKFRATYSTGNKARYYVTRDFLNVLYTLLLSRRKEEAAYNLDAHFKNLKCLPWEDFICKT